MTTRWWQARRAAALAVGALMTMSAVAQAQDVPLTADGQPDMQGYWRQRNNVTTYSLEEGEAHRAEHIRITGQSAATGRPIVDPPDGRIPYQPWAAAKAKYLLDVHNGPERPEDLDPVARGFMEGVPRINLQTGFQILQTPQSVVILYEYGHHYRVIPLDGRPHLAGDILLWMGDSRGRWDGKTLVIDVTNHNDQTWFDQVGNFHSTALKVTERWTVVSRDQIDYEVTVEDPKVFTRPWKMALNFVRTIEPGYEQLEHAVWEGNKSVDLMVRPKQAPTPATQALPPRPLAEVTLSGEAAKRALSESEITAAIAEQLVEACLDYAAAHNAGASIVILSPSGYIVHAHRTDGQSPNNIDSAYYKAKTALYLRQPTRTVFNRWGAPDQQLARGPLDLYLVPGGFPIIVSDRLIGAIGVGGGAGGDDQCALAALTKILGPQPPLPAERR